MITFRRTPKMTGAQYATEVMRIINSGTIRLGMWDDITPGVILRALSGYYDGDSRFYELIVDGSANFRLKPVSGSPGRVRLADYRMSSIGWGELADVAAINEQLAAIGQERTVKKGANMVFPAVKVPWVGRLRSTDEELDAFFERYRKGRAE